MKTSSSRFQRILEFSNILIFSYVFIGLNHFHCKSTPEVVPPDVKGRQKLFIPYSDKKASGFKEFLSGLEKETTSFTGDFTMRIRSGTDTNNLAGKIAYSKELGKLKIQLLDPFFGLVISQIVSDSETIKIKSAGQDKVQNLPMGDIIIKDPNNGKTVLIPYQIIYYSVSMNLDAEFKKSDTFVSPDERKALVKRGKDEYQYAFYDKGLESLLYLAPSRNIKAVCSVPERYRIGQHPPEKFYTVVTDTVKNQDTNTVEIQYKSVKKNPKLSEENFSL